MKAGRGQKWRLQGRISSFQKLPYRLGGKEEEQKNTAIGRIWAMNKNKREGGSINYWIIGLLRGGCEKRRNRKITPCQFPSRTYFAVESFACHMLRQTYPEEIDNRAVHRMQVHAHRS